LPRTELIPISDIEEEDLDPDKPKVKSGVCNLPGPDTPGDELLGNYMCNFQVKNLPFGLKPPAIGCAIRKTGDGKMAVIPTGRDAGSFRGPITETKAAGFRVQGKYKFGGNELLISSCMRMKGAGKYSGSGKGVLNGDKKNRVKYTLTMTRQ
jgi:hypothetical protein